MGLIKVIITDPILWFERTKWIASNCETAEDVTNWGMWQIAQGDIEFFMSEQDAVMYYLHWN
jgi:hypothetical protein